MKKPLFFLLLIIHFNAFSQERGIGIRVGEPFSITYKDFLNDYLSLEGTLGIAGVNSDTYYQEAFENNLPNSDAFYLSNSAKRGVSIQLRTAYHEDFSESFGIKKGYILGYGGLGAQFRTTNVNYVYNLSRGAISQDELQEKRTDINFGPEIFIGVEYYFDEIPINVFVEGGLFLEILTTSPHAKGQGGAGLRYII